MTTVLDKSNREPACVPHAPKVLLLGLGNDILTDDGVGLRVAAAMRQYLAEFENLTVIQTAEMGLALLDFVVGFDDLMLVDAIQTRHAPPGFVHDLDGAELNLLPLVSPHFLGVGEVLALGRKLGLAVPKRVRIFAVEVEDPFTVGTQMTPALQSALPGIVDQVAAALRRMTR